jgi:hypothetical protein
MFHNVIITKNEKKSKTFFRFLNKLAITFHPAWQRLFYKKHDISPPAVAKYRAFLLVFL